MNKEEMLLIMVAEECSEIIQATTKSLRFGLDDYYKDNPSNRQKLRIEFNDLLVLIEILKEEKIIDLVSEPFLIRKKKEKIDKYLEYSKNCGKFVE